jgi:folate-binding protein YgfZ
MTDADRFDADYQTLTSSAGVVDLSNDRSRVELLGPDRVAFLQNFCTNDIRGLPEDRACEAFLLNAKGHVLFYVNVWAGRESLIVEAGAGRGEALVKHLDKYLIREKVTLHDRSAEWGELLVVGPRAEEQVRDLPPGLSGFPSSWTAMPNQVVVGPRHELDDWRSRVVAAGVRACGVAALEALRIEARFPIDGIDVTEKNLAQEVDRIEQTISFKKGCYLGQETVARLDALGHVNKTLVGLTFSEAGRERVPPAGLELTAGGQAVGQVTSSAFSPRLGTAVALGYVKQGHNMPGTRLDSSHGPVVVGID